MPQPGQEDHRGFEWYYLWNKCEQGNAELNIAHPSAVRSIAFSPDGNAIASGAADGAVRVWDSHDGSWKATLFGDTDRVDAVAYSPRDGTLASTGLDGTIRIWDPQTARERLCLSGHLAGVTDLRFSPDGSEIVSTGWDDTIRTWNARTGELIATIPVRASLVSVAESQQAWICNMNRSDEVQRIDTRTGAILQTLPRSETHRPTKRMGATHSRQIGISGAVDGVVRFFRLTDGTDLVSRAIHRTAIQGIVSTSADERYCATADRDGRLVVWNLDSLAPQAEFRVHSGGIRGTAFSPDGHRVASGGFGWLKVSNIDEPRKVEACRVHTGYVLAEAFHPSGRWLATAG
jgi:WD40 repeat protein